MANFKGNTGNDWPVTTHNKIIEDDPQIVKVPMDDVDFGATKGVMARARRPNSGGNGKLHIEHVGKDATK